MEPGVQYLLEACVKLKCSIDTEIRALILYHHFMTCIGEVKYDAAIVAASALNLSCKISEETIDLDTLVLLFYCIVNKTSEVLEAEDKTFLLLKKSLITVDFIMQRMLEFNLNHRLAHQYLLPFLEFIFARSAKIASYHQALSETCLTLISDFYTSKKCLNYKPEHISVACIDCVLGMYELKDDLEINDPWYEALCSDFNRNKLRDIRQDITLLYASEFTGNKTISPTPLVEKGTVEKSEVLIIKEQCPREEKEHEEIVLD